MRKYKLRLESILSSKLTCDCLPKYVFEDDVVGVGVFCFFYYKILLVLIKVFVKWRLKIWGSSYKRYKGFPANKEVASIYHREATTYERKHHLTTNFRDTWWRRQVGLEILNYICAGNRQKKRTKILDICTGIGLSLEEMFRVFSLFEAKIDAVGLDYNRRMLDQAERLILPRMTRGGLLKEGIREVRFTRGDARKLIEKEGFQSKGFERFARGSFDCVTIMFGIGGVDSPLDAIKENLAVLKPNGILVITDIHKPIVEMRDRWPWFIGQNNSDAFLLMSWEEITKPLVLASLWGWRDPSPLFYLAPLVTDYDKKQNVYYGFKQESLFLNNEFWWLRFPTIPTAKIVLRKVAISQEEFKRKQNILNNISFRWL